MNLNNIFTKTASKTALMLLLTASLVGCNTGTNASSGVDATGQSDVNGAVEDDTVAQNEVEIEDNPGVGVGEDIEDNTPEQTQAEENVTTEDVAENAEDLIGQTVTIRSNALEQIEPDTFTVADQEFFGGEDIVVVNATGTAFELPTGDDPEVQVTGEVTQFVLADVESAYDLDLDPDLYVDYTDRPAIIAESLALAPEPGEIAADPAQYYGQTLAVTGEVEEIYSENSFTLDEDKLFGGKDLLVIVNNSTEAPIQDGETVAATGELRSFVIADLETDYDLTWDLDVQKQLEAEYTERPVLVVDRVYPSAIPGVAK